MNTKTFKSNVLAYQDTVRARLDEELVNNWINNKEYKYLTDNIIKISIKCVKKLEYSTPLDEELMILDKSISEVLMEMPVINKTRKNEIFDRLIEYVSEHCSTEYEEYRAYKNIIGLSDREMKELGIVFENNYENLEDDLESDRL